MDPALKLTPLKVQSLLKHYSLFPKKSLGQNFLVDIHALEKVSDAAGDLQGRVVLEIGPGLGSLTRVLCQKASKVIAVELDRKMIPVLNEVLEPFQNVEIVQGDILKIIPSDLIPDSGYYVVANIPYNITSAIIRHLLETTSKPEKIVLTIQQEVAQRICALPGDSSMLSLSVHVFGNPKIVGKIPAGAFFPVPDVDSAILRVDLHAIPLISPDKLDTFFVIARAGFSQKRKTLRNALAAGLRMPSNEVVKLLNISGIDPMRRAETITIEEWKNLTENYLSRSR